VSDQRMTADEFLVWIETQSERYELVDGVPVRMVDAKDSSVMPKHPTNSWRFLASDPWMPLEVEGNAMDDDRRREDILIGRVFPDTADLLRGLPFSRDSLSCDLHRWSRRVLRQYERLEPARDTPEWRIVVAARALREAAADMMDGDISTEELAGIIRHMIDALPEDEEDAQTRCRIYLGALDGEHKTMTIDEAAARLGFSPSLVRNHVAAGDLPLTLDGGVRLADVLALEERQRALAAYSETTEEMALIVKREILRQAGGYLEEELAADWLGMTAEELRRHAEAGDLLAVSFDGRLLVPAFQLRNSMTVLRVREILAVMPIRSPWMRLEWFVTPDDALGGLTPLEAFQRGREAEVRELARGHGAD
jgi:hypothetical protein